MATRTPTSLFDPAERQNTTPPDGPAYMPDLLGHVPRPFFSGNPLDRGDDPRRHPEALGTWLSRPESHALLLLDGKPVTHPTGEPFWFPQTAALADAATAQGATTNGPVLLGLDGTAPRYAMGLTADSTLPPPVAHMLSDSIKPRELRGLAAKRGAPVPDLGVMAQARAMLHFHTVHRQCGNCGAPTRSRLAGYERACTACDRPFYPRTDPVAIMLAVHGRGADEKVLVGRGHGWPEDLYSALAGFVEPGESLEEATARELHEEAGVQVTSVRYVVSQPWPWPSSLMLASLARVEGDTIALDETELADAFWIDRAEAEAALAGTASFSLPPTLAVAGTLIRAWCNGMTV
ncbi:NAD(+) diphosphatase [Yunchengibacter salinarum]|uniref:NAD(+) diphosphatase n=1 Tax=Yunchengibacter salinarum TaxID=3133399 RepID=UPI0035B625AF